ncbi:MAG: hypothetical protein WA960_11130 [Tunicatimonas sp.]
MRKPALFSSLTKTAAVFLMGGVTLFSTGCDEDYLQDIFRGDTKDPETTDARIFASTNTGGNFAIFDVSDPSDVDRITASTGSTDADGIYYREDKDIVYQLSRTQNVVNAYTNIMDLESSATVTPAFSSTSDFTNGREIAVSGDKLVVAEDVDSMNQFVVYHIEHGALTLDRIYDVDIDLWGIQLVGNTLYAVQDQSNMLAVYYDFGSKPAGHLVADQIVAIEGLMRTHGLSYDAKNDIMVLTDIADAMSDSDGAFHVIEHFTRKLNDAGDGGTIALKDQIRVAGDKTYLGNPVDIAFSVVEKKVYVAERANGGGRLLIFDYPSKSGSMKPVANLDYAGASAVYLDEAAY